MITEPAQAEHILRTCQADIIFLARELLRDPYWKALHADDDLGGPQGGMAGARYQRARLTVTQPWNSTSRICATEKSIDTKKPLNREIRGSSSLCLMTDQARFDLAAVLCS